MNTITTNECAAIIDKLADKTLSLGCKTSKGTICSTFESEGSYSYAMTPSSCCWNGTI